MSSVRSSKVYGGSIPLTKEQKRSSIFLLLFKDFKDITIIDYFSKN